ncbi:sulfatase domain protein [Aspergillus lucknowensis]|uniref:Sulfatase N-terminal domain-containing protein n=1 Tax=Aspergillus lucknowensis TaxID=176173 RepID=A0ABR4LU26_9EURO
MGSNRPVGNHDYTQSTVVIIGAGISGMCMAIDLLRRNHRNFVILEKGSSIGGTWNDNKYPGCACDVWSTLYSYSFEQRAEWTREYPGQEEILAYLTGIASKYGLYPHIRFNSTVKEARWDGKDRQWKVQVSVSGSKASEYHSAYELSANVLISGVGQLNLPRWPDIPGIDDFKGKSMHSARWDWTYDFGGKRIAVIGNGATAVQIVPELVKTASHVSVYQRTPQWIIPRMDMAVHPAQKALLTVPLLRRCKRAIMMYLREQTHDAIVKGDSAMSQQVRDMSRGLLRKGLPDKPELWDILTPNYPPGCRRILSSDDYYPALNLDHVKLETRDIQRITESGIETVDGENTEFDLIVYATGFRTVEFLHPIKMYGARGRELSEIWDGGATAYYGVTVEDMPNFGLLYGPNTNLGHNSIILMIEAQSRYLAALLDPVIRGKESGRSIAFQLRTEIVQEFNRDLQEWLAKSTFADPSCKSWYKTTSGRITNNWPGTVVEYQKGLSEVRWSDYLIEGDANEEFAGQKKVTRIGHVEEIWPINKSTLALGLSPFRRCTPIWNRLRSSPVDFFDAFWNWTRRFFFTLGFLALFSAKTVHIYAHLHSLPAAKLFLWCITFYTQDVAFTIFVRILTQKFPWRWLDAIAAVFVIPFSLMMSGMASANISFYFTAGAEINWRQAKSFHSNAAAIRTLLTGLTGFLIVEAVLAAISWFFAPVIHRIVGGILHVLAEPFKLLLKPLYNRLFAYVRSVRGRYQPLPDPEIYEQIAANDYDDFKSDDESEYMLNTSQPPQQSSTPVPLGKRLAVWLPLCVLAVFRLARPPYPSYIFLSSALPMTPFAGMHRPTLSEQAGNIPDYVWLEGQTALAEPPAWDWMPPDTLPGFEDWKGNRLHYTPSKDPLHLSNLQEPVLDPLRAALSSGDVNIKHVILLKLESTRGDVFPLRNGSFIWDKIVGSFDGKEMPESAVKTVANLTRTAEYLTGFDSGFDQYREGRRKAFGGISARNGFTTGTYTIKSLTGTLCGITPLVADFNREYKYHIYQPCMPHVVNALSHQNDITEEEDYRTWPWHSIWMQSVTDGYDHQDKLTPKLGFEDIYTKERIEKPDAKHYPLKYKEVNYYGYADTELADYIRDAIDDAEANHQRLFLGHLTGTTHHPWGMPKGEYENILGPSFKGKNSDFNKYLNTIGFGDRWIRQIMDILEEKGVANETLLVMAGDHGISLPNDGGITPYSNPHIGSFHVPIVLAHPQLPAVEVTDPVISLQIVPTILDLLIESSSLGPNTTEAAKDIRGLYEGQSLIRPLYQESDGMEDWQFSVMNTGGSWLAVRSAAMPAWRIVVPLIDDVEWRFTDVEKDPQEENPITSFSFYDLTDALWQRYGDEKRKKPHHHDDDDEDGTQKHIFRDNNARGFSDHHPPPPHPPHHPHGPPLRVPSEGPGRHPPPHPAIAITPGRPQPEDRPWEPEVVRWARDAAHMAEWWIADNHRRYEYKK